jgi:type II secretory pathway component PulM
MFNNPFREQALAASANRQQLDRPLRITAPRERIVLAAVGLMLAGIGAWALFSAFGRHSLAVLLGLGSA